MRITEAVARVNARLANKLSRWAISTLSRYGFKAPRDIPIGYEVRRKGLKGTELALYTTEVFRSSFAGANFALAKETSAGAFRLRSRKSME